MPHSTGGLADVRQQVESGKIKWDVMDVLPGDAIQGCQEGLFKNISRHQWELEKVLPIAFSVHTGKTIERNNVSSRIRPPKDPWAKCPWAKGLWAKSPSAANDHQVGQMMRYRDVAWTPYS